MGLAMSYTKDLIDAIRGKRVTSTDEYIAASVSPQEISFPKSQRRPGRESANLMSKSVGLASICASGNASTVATQKRRLFRSIKGTSRIDRSHWRAQEVNRKTLDYLASGQAGTKIADLVAMGEVEEVVDHPIIDLFDRPNETMTGFEFHWLRAYVQEIAGKAYELPIYQDSEFPTSIEYLAPQHTEPYGDETGKRLIGGYRYSRWGHEVMDVPPDDVVELRFAPNPEDPFDGWSWVRNVFDEIELIAANQVFDKEFAEGGFMPNHFIKLPDAMGDAERKRIETQIHQRHSGAGRGKMLAPIIAKFWEIVTLPVNSRDLQTMEKLEHYGKTIRQAAGWTESMADSNDSTYASAVTGWNSQYLGGTIRPRLTRDAEQMTVYYLPLFGEDPSMMNFAYDDPVPSDKDKEVINATALVNAGIQTPNEAAVNLGLPKIPGNDVARVGGQSVAALDAAAARPPMPSLTIDTSRFSGATEEDRNTTIIEPEIDTAKKKNLDGGLHLIDRLNTVLGHFDGHSPYRDAEQCNHGQKITDDFRVDEVLEQEDLISSMVEEALEELVQDVVDNPDGVNVDEHVQRLADNLEPELRNVVTAGVADAGGELPDSTFEVVPQSAIDFANDFREEFSRLVVQDAAEQMSNAVVEGLRQGQTIDEIAENLGDIPKARAERIARTEVQRARQGGKLATLKEAGIAQKEWVLAPGNCPFCGGLVRDNGGTGGKSDSIPIDQPFVESGSTLVGTDGKSRTIDRDVQHPPLHPNCRCQLRAVLEDE